MRLVVLKCCLALVVALPAVGCSGDEPAGVATEGNFSLEQARVFGDFPLYAPGESFGELALTSVQRAFDASPDAPPVRSNYVDFIYGTCDASEQGCAPPLSVQVWAACERNPMVYGAEAGREGPLEVRGVPGYFFENGRRLELSTGTSTVVIFAADRDSALSAASALEGVNNQVTADAPLPPPAYTREAYGGTSVIPCAYEDPTQSAEQDPAKAAAVASALEKELAAGAKRGDNPRVRSVECFRSGAIQPAVAVDDVHTCAITWRDGSSESWCVFSSKKRLYESSLPGSCEESTGGNPLDPPQLPPAEVVLGDAELAWGAHAYEACGPWRDREMNAIAELDQELLIEDLSYIWFVMRPFEAGILRDLRAIPGRKGSARRVVALYERRVAAIDAGLAAWNDGKKRRALALFDRAQRAAGILGPLFGVLRADSCTPP
jgi:hypothetical protein